MKQKLSFLFVAILLCLAVLAGCGTGEGAAPAPAATTHIIGFSQLGEESAWRLANTNSIIQAGKDAGVQVMYDNAQQKQENQIKAIRSYIAYKVDAIVFAPIVETGWDAVLQEAQDAGIPVILEDRYIDEELDGMFVSWIGSDFYAAGGKAAEFMLTKFPDPNDEVNIVELTGTADSTAAEDRHKGFLDAIEGDDRFHILHSESGDFMISKGREVMKKILSQNDPQDIDVLFSHNDDMSLGAIEAIEEAGLVPGRDIVIITVDAQQKIIDLIAEGKVNCAVECNPHIGPQVFDLVEKVLADEDVPKKVYSEERVFTEYDDLSTLPARGY